MAKNSKAKLTLRLRNGTAAQVGVRKLRLRLVTSVLNDSVVSNLALLY